MYLARDGEALIILFGGGTKRGQQKDIDQAKALLVEYKERKKISATAKKAKRQSYGIDPQLQANRH